MARATSSTEGELGLAPDSALLVLTGAGVSAESGLPTYRGSGGLWRSHGFERLASPEGFRADPALVWRFYSERREAARAAQPNAGHRALAEVERRMGERFLLVTQNVDGLHQRAGSRRVVDLHGRLDEVECLDCGGRVSRHDVQQQLIAWNPGFADAAEADAPARPDGDAQWEADLSSFEVPHCPSCGGVLKPAVVFFGENVPRPRVDAALQALRQADALLVVGSSLMVFSGYRFCLAARDAGQPVAAVNLGRTRADDLLSLKVEEDCAAALTSLVGDALA